jgi:hypothetical protein
MSKWNSFTLLCFIVSNVTFLGWVDFGHRTSWINTNGHRISWIILQTARFVLYNVIIGYISVLEHLNTYHSLLAPVVSNSVRDQLIWLIMTARMDAVQFPAGAGKISLCHRVHTGTVAHQVSYPTDTRGSFPGGGVKRSGREAEHLPPSSAEVKNM